MAMLIDLLQENLTIYLWIPYIFSYICCNNRRKLHVLTKDVRNTITLL